MSELGKRLTSRKFLLAIASVLFVLVQLGAGTVTAPEAVDAIRTIVVVYIGVEGAADVVSRAHPTPGA